MQQSRFAYKRWNSRPCFSFTRRYYYLCTEWTGAMLTQIPTVTFTFLMECLLLIFNLYNWEELIVNTGRSRKNIWMLPFKVMCQCESWCERSALHLSHKACMREWQTFQLKIKRKNSIINSIFLLFHFYYQIMIKCILF